MKTKAHLRCIVTLLEEVLEDKEQTHPGVIQAVKNAATLLRVALRLLGKPSSDPDAMSD